MPEASAASHTQCCILAFDGRNRLAVRLKGATADLAFTGLDLAGATAALESEFKRHTPTSEFFTTDREGSSTRVFLVQVGSADEAKPAAGKTVEKPNAAGLEFRSIDELQAPRAKLSPELAGVLRGLEPHLVDVPYLHLGENDFIYKFRPPDERRAAAYPSDLAAEALYQSALCSAIKAVSRRNERSAAAPLALDFGSIQYVIPSHFGFCLGVKNAIERAYETLAENPGRRVFMLSELIHNPFVNEDLLRRGLRYLQTDRGIPFTVEGVPSEASAKEGVPSEASAKEGVPADSPAASAKEPLLWDTLTPEDIVVIPAFGATDEDKARLVRKGLPIFQYDATCMLVEKVWRAARAYGREGYTIVIHGKHEHEETKATFSNTRRVAPAVIVRDLDEARQLGAIIASSDPTARARFHQVFAGRCTPGFDPDRHLERIAVVNQTTLLMNETIAIIDYLKSVYRDKYGDDSRVGGDRSRDTLCYATQVNQDALARALGEPLDAAFVVGGRNSSNTYQLYRLCERKLGPRAFFIPSEAAVLSAAVVAHSLYGSGTVTPTELRPLWPDGAHLAKPQRVLITGGASCPDGVIQQVIVRLNSFFPPDRLRPIEDVLREVD